MKQVQVFKKTLLSVAVVTVLGGYATLSQGKETEADNETVADSGTASTVGATKTGDKTTTQASSDSEASLKPRLPTIEPEFILANADPNISQSDLLGIDDPADVAKRFKKDDGTAKDHAKITGLDLTNPEGGSDAETVLNKVAESGTIKLNPSKGANSRSLQFDHKELTLSGKNNPASAFVDVTGPAVNVPTPATAAETDPSGTYVVSGSKTKLYHTAIGAGQDEGNRRPLEKVIVSDGAELKVNMEGAGAARGITVQHIKVDQNGKLQGYTMDGGTERPDYAKIVGAVPSTEVVNDKKHRATLTLDNPKDAMLFTNKVAEIKVTGGNLEIPNAADNQLGNVWENPGDNSEGKGTLKINLSGASVRVLHPTEGSDGASDSTSVGVMQAEDIAISDGSTVKSVQRHNIGNGKVERDGLITIKGANLKLQREDGNGYELVGDKLSVTGEGTEVFANIEDIEKITLGDGATLISNSIGTDGGQVVTNLTLNGKATLTRFMNNSNTIYGSESLEVSIGKDQTVIQDFKGFKSITLNGGVLEGSLTGSGNGEDGSVLNLASGEFRGGTVDTVAAINITGNVHLKPSQTELPSYADATNKNKTALKSVVLTAPVTVQSGGNLVIHKATADATKAVEANAGVKLNSGASLTFVLDHAEGADSRTSNAHLKVTGDFNAAGSNKIYGAFKSGSPELAYQAKRELYEASKQPGMQAPETPYTVITAGTFTTPENLTVESTDPFFLLTGGVVDNSAYKVAPSYNRNSISALMSAGLTENEAQVALAAQETALSVPMATPAGVASTTSTTGAAMDKSISDADYKKTAQMEGWDAHNGAAMAAVTVHQKTNQSISRHLNSSRTGISTGDMFESQGFWGEYMFSDGEMKEKDGISGYKNKVNGITLGADNLLNDQLTVGFAFTYGDVKSETKGASREADSKTYMGTLYTGWTQDNFFFDTMFSYGSGSADYKRQGVDGSYKGDGDNTIWGARFVAGYNYLMNEWILQPQAEFNYANAKFDDLKEKGGNFAQKVSFSDFEVMELGLGAKLMAEFEMGNGVLKPEFTLMGYHDFKDKKAEVEGTYLMAGGKTYTVTGSGRDQNRFLAGLGVSYAMDNNLSFGLNYDYNWQGDYKAQGFVASVRYEF